MHLSCQLKDLLKRSIDSWLGLFDYSNRKKLPAIRVTLTLEDGKMVLYPTADDLSWLVLHVIEQITNTLQMVNHRVSHCVVTDFDPFSII
jgi:hypothetical protein